MSDYGVTPQGFVPKRLDVIMEEIHADLTKGFGVDTTLNPESFLNVLVTGFADKVAELWEVQQDVYYSLYPSSAEDLSLDNAVQFGGIRRIGDQPTYYPMHCTGKDGTVIPAGTIIASTTNPEVRFTAPQSKAISRDSFNRAVVKIVALQPDSTYTVGINGELYKAASGPEPSAQQIIQDLCSALADGEYAASVDGDFLHIRDTSLQRSSTLMLSENLTTESVTTISNFASVNYGKVILPNGTITKIITNVDGLKECANLIPPIYGRLRETNTELRQSYMKRIYVRSDGMLESIESAIIDNVQGIISVRAYENKSNVWDSEGRPPHCVEIVADGGSEIEIARQILRKKAGGIQTHGSVKVEIPDLFGRTIPVNFNRPQFVYVWMRITLTIASGQSVPPNYAELAKESIIGQSVGLNVGDWVYPQKFIGELYRKIAGVSFVNIGVFSTTEPGAVPTEYAEGNVSIAVRQKALIDEKRMEVIIRYV